MSSLKPLNVNTGIVQQSLKVKSDTLKGIEPKSPNLSDSVEISKIAIEKSQQTDGLKGSEAINENAKESIHVNSTTGHSTSASNLTYNQAIDIYKEITKLI